VSTTNARPEDSTAIAALIANCLGIRSIAVSGDDRMPGRVNASGLEEVLSDAECGRRLRHLDFLDKSLDRR
jgi:hypothetical protein